MNRAVAALLVGALLALAPAVEAGMKPVAYFLKDGEPLLPANPPDAPPSPVPVPIGATEVVLTEDGVLDPYDPLAGNFPNSTTPKSRPLAPASDELRPLQFLTPANHTHAERIKGSILLGLFPGSSAIVKGNLSATLYEVRETGAPVALASASVALDFNASKLPNATSLVPPNSTDPMAILLYEMARLSPALQQPAAYFLLGPLDLNLTNGTRLALGVRLDPGSSPAPSAVGATTSLQYDSLYTPSFVVVPWYATDVPKVIPAKSSTLTSSGQGGAEGSDSSSGGDQGGSKQSPGPELALMAALLAFAVVLARRRML